MTLAGDGACFPEPTPGPAACSLSFIPFCLWFSSLGFDQVSAPNGTFEVGFFTADTLSGFQQDLALGEAAPGAECLRVPKAFLALSAAPQAV